VTQAEAERQIYNFSSNEGMRHINITKGPTGYLEVVMKSK